GEETLFYKELMRRVRDLPGVETAGAADCLPTSSDVQGGRLHFTDRPEPKESERPIVVVSSITPGYLQTMKIPLIRGRYFSEADGATDPLVMIVDQGLARQYWPNRDPIGQVIRLRLKAPLRKIVGVVGNIERSVAVKMKGRLGQVYTPFAQSPDSDPNGMTLAISTHMNPVSLSSTVRGTIASLAPDQPVFQ